MWNGTSHAIEIFRISATNICGQVASSRNPAWGVKKFTDILDKKQACGGSVLCCFSPLLCMYYIYIYANMYRVNTNCWFDIKDQTADFSFMCCFSLLRSTLGKRKPSTWVQKIPAAKKSLHRTFFRVAWWWRLGGRFCYRGSKAIHCEKGFLLGGMVQNSKAPAHHEAHWTIIEPSTETII